MVKVRIQFSNLLAEEIAKEVMINSPDKDSLTIIEFLTLIKKQKWANLIVENDHLKTSIVLIVNDEIIQFANPTNMIINETSKISCHIMFAGG